MSGDVRVLVTPPQLGPGSLDVPFNERQWMADTIASNIQKTIGRDRSESALSYTIWGSSNLSPTLYDERQFNTRTLAEQVNANIVVYGTVVEDGRNGALIVGFSVLDVPFADAAEVLGSYTINRPIRYNIPFSDAFSQETTSAELEQRLEILAVILRGVSASFDPQKERGYTEATARFDEALVMIEQTTPGTQEEVTPCTSDTVNMQTPLNQSQGNQQLESTIWLLKANAAARAGAFEDAEVWYTRALTLNCSYARPYLGLAVLKTRLALQPPPSGVTLANDETYRQRYKQLLEDARHNFTLAREATSRPEQALFAERLNYAQGEWHLANALLQDADASVDIDIEAAIRSYSFVIASFDDSPPERQRLHVLRSLTASSLANRGLAAWMLENRYAALRDYQRAIEIEGEREPERVGLWWQRIAQIQLDLGECSKGRSALGEAQRLRPQVSYSDLRQKFTEQCPEVVIEHSTSNLIRP
jgi:tetratricopeptide (TPR) repeat protein